MKTICAYCKRHKSGDKNDPIISHGICPACSKKLLAGWDFTVPGPGLPVIWKKKEKADE